MEEQLQLMEASEYKKTLMHKLISKQRRTSRAVDEIVFDGISVSGENLATQWRKYFQDLATPAASENYDAEYKQSSEVRNLILQTINKHHDTEKRLSSRLDEDLTIVNWYTP